MKLIDGLFKYGETVTVEIKGKLYKRKVHYADDKVYISIDGKKYVKADFAGSAPFDKSAYLLDYMKNNRDRISVVAPKGTKEKWRTAAVDYGTSMNAFIIYCVEKEIDRENTS